MPFLTTCIFPLATLKALPDCLCLQKPRDAPCLPEQAPSWPAFSSSVIPCCACCARQTQRPRVQGQVTEFSRVTAGSCSWTWARQGRRTFGAKLPLRGGSPFSRTEEATEGHFRGGWSLPHA